MIHSSFCYCFEDGDFADNLKRLAGYGFEAVELWHGELEKRPIEETVQALADAGLKCSQICPYFNFVHSTDEWYESLQIGMEYIERAKALGNPLIRVFTGPLGENEVCGADASPEQWDAAIRGLALLCAQAEDDGIKFCLEIHHGQLAEDSHTALRLLEGVRSPSLVANPQIKLKDEDPWYSLGRLAGHIAHFHAHNWDENGNWVLLSKGLFDWESYLAMALKDGFDGCVSIEHAGITGGGNPWVAAEADGRYLSEMMSRINA